MHLSGGQVSVITITWQAQVNNVSLDSRRTVTCRVQVTQQSTNHISDTIRYETKYLQCVKKLKLKISHSYGGIWTTSNTWFLGPIRAHNPNGIWIGSAVFAQLNAECRYTIQWAAPFPQDCPFPRRIWALSNTRFLGPTWVLNPNSISTGWDVFAGLTTVTDRQGWLVGWLEFNVPFQHKYGYITQERSEMESYPLTQWRKASDILTSTLAAFLFSSHPKRERDCERLI